MTFSVSSPVSVFVETALGHVRAERPQRYGGTKENNEQPSGANECLEEREESGGDSV